MKYWPKRHCRREQRTMHPKSYLRWWIDCHYPEFNGVGRPLVQMPFLWWSDSRTPSSSQGCKWFPGRVNWLQKAQSQIGSGRDHRIALSQQVLLSTGGTGTWALKEGDSRIAEDLGQRHSVFYGRAKGLFIRFLDKTGLPRSAAATMATASWWRWETIRHRSYRSRQIDQRRRGWCATYLIVTQPAWLLRWYHTELRLPTKHNTNSKRLRENTADHKNELKAP